MTSTGERALSWVAPLLVTLLGGMLRFADLGRPHAFVFDETYYAKDAWSLLQHGYERGFVDEVNEKILASSGSHGELAGIFTDDPAFIVHPPVGKWLIAAGEQMFGMTPFGWRFVTALLGTVSILVLARAVRRMTGSTLWGTVAGLLLAIDGLAIVTSRTAVLDGMLMFFVLCAFALLLIDRDRSRSGGYGGHWVRPWRWAAAVSLGLACGVKWSGLWYLAAFALLTVVWDGARRHREGQPWTRALLADAIPAALGMFGIALVVYLTSWWGWFNAPDAWSRDWASGAGPGAALSSLAHYHAEILRFHTTLTSHHSYASSAFGWLVQARPTSFYYDGNVTSCPSGSCASAVTALGNPLLWWAAALALLHQIWIWFAHRDWRSGAVLMGVAAGWVPWLFYPDRTMFTMYAIVFLPFLVAGLTLSLARFTRVTVAGDEARDRTGRVAVVALFLIALVAGSWFFYPVWTGEIIDQAQWSWRMWWPTWV